MFSSCDGNKKAVLVGIDYAGTSQELNSAGTDLINFASVLRDYGFNLNRNARPLSDVGPRYATKSEILRQIRWLVSGARKDDSLFFFYAGHGGIHRSTNYIVALNRERITSDELHRALVDPLPRGCGLTIVLDCCNAGSMLNLRYNYMNRRDVINADPTIYDDARRSSADVVCWAGSQDNQTARENYFDGWRYGVMTHAFESAAAGNRRKSFLKLFDSINRNMSGFSQKLQLSTTNRINADQVFTF
ncbi:peptidase C14, caspase domain-containing protein [Russula compacta]|nr:peptidase C14, caspase domain-containing protein [Russula compacta]